MQPDFTLFSTAAQQNTALQQAAQEISATRNWQDKYRLLMQAGKLLPTLAANWRTDAAKVQGCESDAWLYHCSHQGQHFFLADSDARIVKGLIVLLLAQTNGGDDAQLRAFDPAAYLACLGLTGQLSPSRSNGLYALAAAIKNAPLHTPSQA